MNPKTIAAAGLALLALAPRVWSAPKIDATLVKGCAYCHGDRGLSSNPAVPNIGGQLDGYMLATLKQFRMGERPSTVMGRLMKGYTDKELASLAQYYGTQKPERAKQAVDPATVARGEQVHKRTCKQCHLDGGRESEGDAPLLAGQWLEYLRTEMGHYLERKRPMDDKMQVKMDGLSREEVDAALQFFASQH